MGQQLFDNFIGIELSILFVGFLHRVIDSLNLLHALDELFDLVQPIRAGITMSLLSETSGREIEQDGQRLPSGFGNRDTFGARDGVDVVGANFVKHGYVVLGLRFWVLGLRPQTLRPPLTAASGDRWP